MRQNAYLFAKIGADTAENDRIFSENLPKIGNCVGAGARAGPRAQVRAEHVRLGARRLLRDPSVLGAGGGVRWLCDTA